MSPAHDGLRMPKNHHRQKQKERIDAQSLKLPKGEEPGKDVRNSKETPIQCNKNWFFLWIGLGNNFFPTEPGNRKNNTP